MRQDNNRKESQNIGQLTRRTTEKKIKVRLRNLLVMS